MAIGADGRSEVIDSAAIRQVDRLTPPDSKKWAETKAGNAFHVAFRVPAGVLVEQRRPSLTTSTVAAPAASVNAPLKLLGRADLRTFDRIVSIEKAPIAGKSGGGGNRTRVRGRTVKSVYKLVLRLDFARRLVRRRPTDGLAIL
jgi:hypothetical protein